MGKDQPLFRNGANPPQDMRENSLVEKIFKLTLRRNGEEEGGGGSESKPTPTPYRLPSKEYVISIDPSRNEWRGEKNAISGPSPSWGLYWGCFVDRREHEKESHRRRIRILDWKFVSRFSHSLSLVMEDMIPFLEQILEPKGRSNSIWYCADEGRSIR